MLRIKEDKQVDMGKTFLLELNGMDMSYSSTKEAIINELEEYFLLLLKDLWYNVRTISSYLAREETMDDFWPLGISSHGKKEVWFVKVSANSHSILEQLGQSWSMADYLQQVAYMGLKDQVVLLQAKDTISIKEEI